MGGKLYLAYGVGLYADQAFWTFFRFKVWWLIRESAYMREYTLEIGKKCFVSERG